MASTQLRQLEKYLETISKDLDRTIKFWLKFSHDTEFGGFYNCLSQDGTIYDTLKYGWLQGRQVWTYCKLYTSVPRFRKDHILESAKRGAQFLMEKVCVLQEGGFKRCYFCVTREGKPVKLQRTIFTECFYVMAMAQMFLATKEQVYKNEGLFMLGQIIHWVTVDDSQLGRPKLSGAVPTNHMAVPMMMLCILFEIQEMDPSLTSQYVKVTDWCVEKIYGHVQRDRSIVLEYVSPDGKELPGCLGRHTNPGHAIECGWFLLQLARNQNDETMKRIATEVFMKVPYEYGWDKKCGGLFYFLDADGICPTQLEWNMKLWWPHTEALIAFLMAYQNVREDYFLDKFDEVFQYCYTHFADTASGEWFGYCSQSGEVVMDFKGGPFKGCFHLARCLLMCEKMLQDLISDLKQ